MGLGWYARSFREVIAASFAATLGSHTYLYWASITNRPGLVNQPLAEVEPLHFWTVTLLIYWLLVGMAFSVGYAGKCLISPAAS